MNKGVKLKLSRQTVLLFFVSALTGILKRVVIIYVCVLFHELAHLYMCRILNENVEYIGIYPYGMELKLRDLVSARRQVLISVAGPMVNLLFFVCGFFLLFFVENTYLSFFVSTNLILLIFNLLPCVPLDGSEILRSFVSARRGILCSYTFIKRLSKAVSVIVFALGVILVFYNGNMSLFPVFIIIRRGIILKQDEQVYAAKKILNDEIPLGKRLKIVRATKHKKAYFYLRYISFEYTLLIFRRSSAPLCQSELVKSVKENPLLYIEDI